MKEKEDDNINSNENELIINNINTKTNNNKNNIFNDLIKYIDTMNIQNMNKETELKIISKLNEKHNENIDITLLLDEYNNTIIQYYIKKDLDSIELILIIINYYKTTLLNDISNNNQEKFYKWLINDNTQNQNFFEILIEKQYPLKKQIEFFNKTFLYVNSGDNSLIYKILKNRDNNIFHLAVKQNNIPVLLYLYDKLKNYFPSTNILDIPNNEGMTS